VNKRGKKCLLKGACECIEPVFNIGICESNIGAWEYKCLLKGECVLTFLSRGGGG
jgi:hypothetical protein